MEGVLTYLQDNVDNVWLCGVSLSLANVVHTGITRAHVKKMPNFEATVSVSQQQVQNAAHCSCNVVIVPVVVGPYR